MAGFPVTCDKCGEKLPDVNSTCPKCGSAPKTVHVEARAQIGLRAVARMSTRKIEEEIRKNWPLVLILAAIYLVSMIPSYFLSGWWSVAANLIFIILSTAVSYYAITRIITITIDHGR